MVEKWWLKLKAKFETVDLDEFVVMPNHIQGIIKIRKIDFDVRVVGANPCVRPVNIEEHLNQGQTHGSAPTLGLTTY